MKQSQNMIAAINHRRVIRNISWLDCWLFHQSLKNLAIVERLFWQLGTRFSGPCPWVAVVRVWTVCQNKIKWPYVKRWPLVEVRLYSRGIDTKASIKRLLCKLNVKNTCIFLFLIFVASCVTLVKIETTDCHLFSQNDSEN